MYEEKKQSWWTSQQQEMCKTCVEEDIELTDLNQVTDEPHVGELTKIEVTDEPHIGDLEFCQGHRCEVHR